MANLKDYKILGQAAPAAGNPTPLYIVPTAKQAVGSTLNVCNRNNSIPLLYSIAVVPAGQNLNDQHYIAYNQRIDAADSIPKTIGWSLNEGDRIIVIASAPDLSFTLFGCELTPQ